MKPRIFISSTVTDLLFMREALKDMVLSLGYEPVLSEHNGVPYLPDLAPSDSCFKAIATCDVAIVILSKRYGDTRTQAESIGITHKEFRAAKENRLPTYCLVDQDLLVLIKVWEKNSAHNPPIEWPELDHPHDIFRFLAEVNADAIRFPYESAEQACNTIRTQLAYLFKELLTQKRLGENTEQQSILQELALIRKQVDSLSTNTPLTHSFITATSLFVEDTYKELRQVMTKVSQGLEAGITDLLHFDTFDEYLNGKRVRVLMREDPIGYFGHGDNDTRIVQWSMFAVAPSLSSDTAPDPFVPVAVVPAQTGFTREGELVMNSAARRHLAMLYASVRAMASDDRNESQSRRAD